MMKRTKQKQLLLNQLKKMHTHPTADEVFCALNKQQADISLATVYRHLNAFTQNGDIKRIQKSGSADKFDGRLDEHHHFICEQCGAISDVDLDIEINLSDTSLSVHKYDVVLYGICDKCKNKDNQN